MRLVSGSGVLLFSYDFFFFWGGGGGGGGGLAADKQYQEREGKKLSYRRFILPWKVV